MANAAVAAPFIIEGAIPGNVGLVPATITRSIPINASTEEYRARLRSGGTLRLKDTTFEIGELPEFGANRYAFMALDVLEMDNATIVTNGNTLALVVNVIKSNNSRIIAFRPEEKKAVSGANGGPGLPGRPGTPGDGGGLVSIHVIDRIEGTLNVELHGQDGGDGGHGGAGAPGARGVKGHKASSTIFGCSHGGGKGGTGLAGQGGGPGGQGGNGGQGGYLVLYNVGPTPLTAPAFNFAADPGRPGSGGRGGPGGAGGEGGEGGDGEGFCNGGPPGDRGPDGPNGFAGPNGFTAASGSLDAKNLDLEVVIRVTVGERPLLQT